MGSVKIYLDDIRTPVDDSWIVVRNYNEFISNVLYYGLENIELISLDHDLGDINQDNIPEKTGLDCCKFLVNHSMDTKKTLPLVYVHSANPIGSTNMIRYINNYLMNCTLPQTCVSVNIEHTV